MSDEVMTTCTQCGRLMAAPGGYLCDHTRYWPDRAALEAENQALREALEFYADPDTYLAIGFFPDPPCGEFMDDFGETGTRDYGPRPGERARKALGYG